MYGLITEAMRHSTAHRVISSAEAMRPRRASRSASIATSSPILLRYRKQSTTVRAGDVTLNGIPCADLSSTSYFVDNRYFGERCSSGMGRSRGR